MAPRTIGMGPWTAVTSQRAGSDGCAGRRSWRSGQREATSSAFRPGWPGSAVVSWWVRPPAASTVARARVGGVARNSDSATTSGFQRAS